MLQDARHFLYPYREARLSVCLCTFKFLRFDGTAVCDAGYKVQYGLL